MKSFLLLAILSAVICVSVSASGATWYVDGSVSSSGDGTTWETALKTIQEGIDKAIEGDTVTVAQGVYVENIQFNGKNIILTSSDPLDLTIVANTVIDGNQAGSVVTFSGTETEACMLSGFTIRNGRAYDGAAIDGAGQLASSRARIRSNIIADSVATHSGGGMFFCDGTIENNTVVGNTAYKGGGFYACNGTIRFNLIADNVAEQTGGGLESCNGAIENNTITRNSAIMGGGLCECGGTVRDNIVSHNTAPGGGGGFSNCHPTVLIQGNVIIGNVAENGSGGGVSGGVGVFRNNQLLQNRAGAGGGFGSCHGVIVGNLVVANASGRGAGLYDCNRSVTGEGVILNNTVVGNLADGPGAALYECGGSVQNCVLWGNSTEQGSQVYGSTRPIFSCIESWVGGGQGNISDCPRFVDGENGDFRLLPDSPCIDAGGNNAQLPETDIGGMHRIMFGGNGLTVDMGAYEFHIWPPTENVEMGEMTLKWSSLAGKIYSVYKSSDMFTWDLLADDVASAGDTVTTWIDPPAPIFPPGVRIRYYKIAENLPSPLSGR